MYFLFTLLDMAFLASLVSLGILPISLWIVRRMYRMWPPGAVLIAELDKSWAAATDDRIRALKELFSSIRVVKVRRSVLPLTPS